MNEGKISCVNGQEKTIWPETAIVKVWLEDSARELEKKISERLKKRLISHFNQVQWTNPAQLGLLAI